jgi:hypothetical protein
MNNYNPNWYNSGVSTRCVTTGILAVIIAKPCLCHEPPHVEPITFTVESRLSYTPTFTATTNVSSRHTQRIDNA